MANRSRRSTGHPVLLRLYGVVFLVLVALLAALSVAIYQKTFVDVVHVSLESDRIGNQLQERSDVQLRGQVVGEVREVRSDGERATVEMALRPQTVGLIPQNVSARLLPKTLFGEKYVDLVIPPRPSPARLSEGDVIPQDRSAVAIELERVLDNLLPLLRTVQPAELNATLSAFATALEGRGHRLGENLQRVDRYFAELNPRLATVKADISGLAEVTGIYADAAPDLVAMLRDFSVGTRTVAEKARAYAGFLAGTAGFARTTRGLLVENEARIIRLGAVSRPILELFARYSPQYPCLLDGIARADRNPRPDGSSGPGWIGSVFAGEELHITLEVVDSRDQYRPGEEPAWGEQRGPRCQGLPHPPIPAPGDQLDDGTRGSGSTSGRAVTGLPGLPGFLLDPASGHAGTDAEQRVVRPLVAPVMGRPADDVPDLATLLFGPMARGTQASVSG